MSSKRVLDDLDDLIHKFYKTKKVDDRETEESSEGKKAKRGYSKKIKKEERELVVYYRNYNNYYRGVIIPIDWIDSPPESIHRDNVPKESEDIEPVFLTKNAKKDVASALKYWGADPDDYIIPATTSLKAQTIPEMKQGVVYCIHNMTTKKHVYYGFHKRGEDAEKESVEIAFQRPEKPRDEKKIEIEVETEEKTLDNMTVKESLDTIVKGTREETKDLVQCRCADCGNVKIYRVISSYKCLAGVFSKYHDVKDIETIIWCNKFKVKTSDPESGNETTPNDIVLP